MMSYPRCRTWASPRTVVPPVTLRAIWEHTGCGIQAAKRSGRVYRADSAGRLVHCTGRDGGIDDSARDLCRASLMGEYAAEAEADSGLDLPHEFRHAGIAHVLESRLSAHRHSLFLSAHTHRGLPGVPPGPDEQ